VQVPYRVTCWGCGDPITSVTVESHNQALYIEKERPQWEEGVVATKVLQ
jgi:hypothetical protein